MLQSSIKNYREVRNSFFEESPPFELGDEDELDMHGYWETRYTESQYDSIWENVTDKYREFGPRIVKDDLVNKREKVDAEVGDDHIQLTDAPMTFLFELFTAENFFWNPGIL